MSRSIVVTGPQKVFCQSLLTQTVPQAARSAGICDRTAQRWLHRPAVRAYLRDLEAQAIEQAGRIGAQFLASTMAVVLKLLQDPLVYPAVRVSAARTVLDGTLRIREVLVGEERLCEIEKKLEELAWMAVGGKDEANKVGED